MIFFPQFKLIGFVTIWVFSLSHLDFFFVTFLVFWVSSHFEYLSCQFFEFLSFVTLWVLSHFDFLSCHILSFWVLSLFCVIEFCHMYSAPSEKLLSEVWHTRPQKGSFVSFLVKCVSNGRSKLEKFEFFRKAVFKKNYQLNKVLVIFFLLWLFFFFCHTLCFCVLSHFVFDFFHILIF